MLLRDISLVVIQVWLSANLHTNPSSGTIPYNKIKNIFSIQNNWDDINESPTKVTYTLL